MNIGSAVARRGKKSRVVERKALQERPVGLRDHRLRGLEFHVSGHQALSLAGGMAEAGARLSEPAHAADASLTRLEGVDDRVKAVRGPHPRADDQSRRPALHERSPPSRRSAPPGPSLDVPAFSDGLRQTLAATPICLPGPPGRGAARTMSAYRRASG